jgi:hypothetical protein
LKNELGWTCSIESFFRSPCLEKNCLETTRRSKIRIIPVQSEGKFPYTQCYVIDKWINFMYFWTAIKVKTFSIFRFSSMIATHLLFQNTKVLMASLSIHFFFGLSLNLCAFLLLISLFSFLEYLDYHLCISFLFFFCFPFIYFYIFCPLLYFLMFGYQDTDF